MTEDDAADLQAAAARATVYLRAELRKAWGGLEDPLDSDDDDDTDDDSDPDDGRRAPPRDPHSPPGLALSEDFWPPHPDVSPPPPGCG